jgi:hypothetical protein
MFGWFKKKEKKQMATCDTAQFDGAISDLAITDGTASQMSAWVNTTTATSTANLGQALAWNGSANYTFTTTPNHVITNPGQWYHINMINEPFKNPPDVPKGPRTLDDIINDEARRLRG